MLIFLSGSALLLLIVLSVALLGNYINSLNPKISSGVLVSADGYTVRDPSRNVHSRITKYDLSVRLKNNRTIKIRARLTKVQQRYLRKYKGPIKIEYSYDGLIMAFFLGGADARPWFIETDWFVSKKERPRFFPLGKPIYCIKQAIDDFDIYSLENQQACKALGIKI